MAGISERIKMLRKANQLSQEDFSKRMNISRSTLTLLEADKSVPSYDLILKMCSEFKISASYFFDEGNIDIDDYSMLRKRVKKSYSNTELDEIGRNYNKEAIKLKLEFLKNKKLTHNHIDILNLLWELRMNIDELKEFSDKYIDLYDPEHHSSFVKYLEDNSTLLTIAAYKEKLMSIINAFLPHKVLIDIFSGQIESFLKEVKPVTEQ